MNWKRWTMNDGLALATMLAAVAMLVVLPRFMGRSWLCACGGWNPWSGEVLSAHNSQHLFDPYSFTHLLHGFALCGLVTLGTPRLPDAWKLAIVVAAEGAWEVIENTNFVIHRYRTATLTLGYEGDTIANSLGDLACCVAGYLLARCLGWWLSIAMVLLVEVVLLLWIRDNLTLNVIMLFHPIDAIKTWQMGN